MLSTKEDSVCPVCHDTTDIYAIGQCDHPICYRCSTRMRILCEQMYCAICRANLPKVLFVKSVNKFDNVNTSSFLIERRGMIFFECENTRQKYKELLEHKCKICRGNVTFQSFKQLEDHMRKEHQLFACKLCVDHIKLLSKDRKFYDRSSLARHKRVGDEDDTSYKGHPSCQFCDERYADNDALLLHLRKDHYFCFICESQGVNNEYYCEYENLREHFRECHFLCEQDECATAQFTNAFPSELDLRAHVATTHAKGSSRQVARQMRTIDIGFSYGPRGRGGARGGGYRGNGRGDDRPYNNNEEGVEGSGGEGGARRQREGRRDRVVDERREKREKERLEVERAQWLAASLAEVHRQGGVSVIHRDLAESSRALQQPQDEADTARPPLEHQTSSDFPTLGDVRPTITTTASGEAGASGGLDSLANKVAYSAKHSVGGALAEEDFPTLPGGATALPAPRRSEKKSSRTVWKISSEQMSGALPSRVDSAVSSGRYIPGMPKSAHDDFPALPANQSKPYKSLSSAPPPSQSKPTKNTVPLVQNVVTNSKTQANNSARQKNKSAHDEDGHWSGSLDSYTSFSSNASAAPNLSIISASNDVKRVNISSLRSDGSDFPALAKPASSDKLSAMAAGPKAAWGSSADTAAVRNSSSKKSKKEKNDREDDSDRPVSSGMQRLSKPSTLSGIANRLAGGVEAKPDAASVSNDKIETAVVSEPASGGKKKKNKNNVNETKKEQVGGTGKGMDKKSENVNETKKEQTHKEVATGKGNIADKKSENVSSLTNGFTTKSSGAGKNVDVSPVTSELSSESMSGDSGKPAKNKNKKNKNTTAENEVAVKDTSSQSSVGVKEEIKAGKDGSIKTVTTTTTKSVTTTTSSTTVSNTTTSTTNITSNNVSNTTTTNYTTSSNGSTQAITPAANFTSDDFPSLAPTRKSSIPPGFGASRAPPGFSQPPSLSSATPKPPPGFSAALETPKLLPSEGDMVYKAPQDIELRNQLLISKIHAAVAGQEELFDVFKKHSAQYRRNEISADKYYNECLQLIGPQSFNETIVELLALLPDIGKQQELLAIHRSYAVSKDRSGWTSDDDDRLNVCVVCGQVLVVRDVPEHMMSHSFDCDYPVIGGSLQGNTAAARGRVGVL